ncbi:MAG TPA: flagellar basal-body MS-ring/collar protein FliF [Aquimonas sp.]|nr:flagellar M-ring protein FliF [Xanthomonadales bacterium]HRF55052.1 flagellar basal-body MS-ring/collar protein FliF [Aquimonas sp.]
MATDLRLANLKDIPAIRQTGALLTLAATIAAGIALFFWSLSPGKVALFSGLGDRDAAEVVEALRAAQIDYEVDLVTGEIRVPEAKVREARMKLATLGLPQGTRAGVESMSENPGFGTSQFVESARYQHALETEIARTIRELRPVREARVHLALPKPSAFTRQRQPASASVMLQLYAGRAMERAQVDAIVHLVASSIPDLAPERVTVIDQAGRLLSQNDPDDPNVLSAMQFEQRRRIEQSLIERIQSLLEPMAGPGRVSAQVSVDMDFSVIEEARESFVPDPEKLRSEQVAESTTSTPQAEGVPGAVANTPPGAAEAAATGPQTASRSSTRNFELDRTLSHSRNNTGRVTRVTAAVLIDHILSATASTAVAATDPAADPAADPASATDADPATTPAATTAAAAQPLTPEQLAQVEELVKQAIGFSAERGDAVTVMNSPFVREVDDFVAEEIPLWQQPWVLDIGRMVLGAGIVLLLIFAVLRPALRSITQPAPRALAADEQEGEDQDHERPLLPGRRSQALLADESEDDANAHGMPDPNSLDEKLKVARAAVSQDPKVVAQVIKNWVATDG